MRWQEERKQPGHHQNYSKQQRSNLPRIAARRFAHDHRTTFIQEQDDRQQRCYKPTGRQNIAPKQPILRESWKLKQKPDARGNFQQRHPQNPKSRAASQCVKRIFFRFSSCVVCLRCCAV